MDSAQAKRNRLPFKAPRRQSEGTNSSTTTNKTTSKTTSRKPSSTSTTSTSKPTSKAKINASKASSSKTKPTTSKTASTANSRKRKAQSISISSDSEDANANPSRDGDNEDNQSSKSTSPEPDYILAEIVTNNIKPRNIESDEPGIPPKLLTTILHHQFQNKKTKITKDANEVVAKYMDIFVREALARAAFERADAANKDGGGAYAGDGFLEVEDLEKLAPQMLLDF